MSRNGAAPDGRGWPLTADWMGTTPPTLGFVNERTKDMKPTGLALTMDHAGLPSLHVKHSSRTEDAIWEAVREAIDANWTPEQFRNEVSSAWHDALRDDAKHAQKVFSK